jgi:hypothetical protein
MFTTTISRKITLNVHRNGEMETSLTSQEFYTSSQGIQALKDDFHQQITTKLCSIDVDTILGLPEWEDFLSNMDVNNK